MLFADDFFTVWVAVVELGGTPVGRRLGAPPLVEGVSPIPQLLGHNGRDGWSRYMTHSLSSKNIFRLLR